MTESMTAATADNLIGTTLDDRFTIDSVISQGGLSVLYKGVDKSTGADVIIRVLTNWRADDKESQGRFKNAVKAASTLNHPNVVPILGSGNTEKGAPYLVLPFIQGRSVREKVEKDGPLSLEEAVPIIKDVAAALKEAHDKGVVHRNLKPSNVLLTTVDGAPRAVLTGFGIAKRAGGSDANPTTQSGMHKTTKVVGSPLYMSPEQFIKSPVDARSDIYSFGCVIHQMLSGKPPFEAPSLVQLMSAHHHQYRAHFAPELNVPSYVEDILDAATMKLPANRYGSVNELVLDLENKKCSLDLKEARKNEPGKAEETQQRQSRIRAIAGVTAAGVLLVAAVMFIVSLDTLMKSHDKAAQQSSSGNESFASSETTDVNTLVDSGRYAEASGVLKNRLFQAEAASQPTAELNESLGALSLLTHAPAVARDYLMRAIDERTKQGDTKIANRDWELLAYTYLDASPDAAIAMMKKHLPSTGITQTDVGTMLAMTVAREHRHEPNKVRELLRMCPEESRHDWDSDVNLQDVDSYLISLAKQKN